MFVIRHDITTQSIINQIIIFQLRGTTFSWFGMKDPKDEAQLSRRRDDLTKEIVAWRVTLHRER